MRKLQDDCGIHRWNDFAVIRNLAKSPPAVASTSSAAAELAAAAGVPSFSSTENSPLKQQQERQPDTLFDYHAWRVANSEDELDSGRTASFAPLMHHLHDWGLSATVLHDNEKAADCNTGRASVVATSWPLNRRGISSAVASSDTRARDLLRYRLFRASSLLSLRCDRT